MTSLKDTLEATNSASEAAVSQGNNSPKPEPSYLSANAVSLEAPVKIHGSRVTDVVLGTTPHTEPFEEHTFTMIVFPHGGVVKMSTPVAAGQMMVLTNLKSGHDAICRVVKVRAYAQAQSYVEIEFTHRQPGYWGVHFAADGPDAAPQTTPLIPAAAPAVLTPVAVDVKIEKLEDKPATDVSWAPAPGSQTATAKLPFNPTAKQESSFVSIGSQEDVQPAASATSRVKPNPFVQSETKSVAFEAWKNVPAIDFAPVPPAAPVASLSMEELQGDTQVGPSISFADAAVPGEAANAPSGGGEPPVEQASATFGRFASTASLGGTHTAAREPFGAGLRPGTLGIGGPASEPHQSKGHNWVLIAAGVAALFVIGAGAAFYFHVWPVGARSASSTAPVPVPATPPVETGVQPNPVSDPVNSAPNHVAQVAPANPPATTSVASVTTQVNEPAPGKPNKALTPAPVAASAPVNQEASAKVPDMFGALNAHPTSRPQATGSGDANSAPVFDGAVASSSESSGLQGIGASPSVALPPPQVAPEVPVRPGGQLKPPRLVSSVLPVYPNVARSNGIEGDVVVDASIDKAGNVIATKIISGPPMLRQAALDALLRWKYEPSRLNGEPVPIQIMVTIRFHHD